MVSNHTHHYEEPISDTKYRCSCGDITDIRSIPSGAQGMSLAASPIDTGRKQTW